MERFRVSMERHPQSSLHCTFEIAECLTRRGQWEEAMSLYQQATFQQPDRVMQMRIFHALQVCAQKMKAEGKNFWAADAGPG